MEEKKKRFENKKLKRKVIYVYESDSDKEGEYDNTTSEGPVGAMKSRRLQSESRVY